MSRDEDHTHLRPGSNEGDVVELLADLLAQVPADESNSAIGSVDVLHLSPGAGHHGLMIETDDGARFHLGVVKVA